MNKVLIYGGLGNQMFQYALSIALNQQGKKTQISFSKFLYEHHHNGFNLGEAFNLKLPFPLNALNFFLLKGGMVYKNKPVGFVFRRLVPLYHGKRYSVYKESREFIYDNNLLQQQSSLLVGVWQVESYFKDVKDLLKEEFVFKKPTDKKNMELIEKINNCNSVSIHIRRGDTLASNNPFGFINYTSYYHNALDYAAKNIEKPHYFVFSDDMQWVKENLNITNCTYVDNNTGKNSYVDMYLMSLCKHNLIANSTFSWWAAWLNKNKNKIVVMPEKWLMRDYHPEGIFPEEWVKIKLD
ncbi:alpha-1,2-fucosyltransferase [Ferruginibacter sp.]